MDTNETHDYVNRDGFKQILPGFYQVEFPSIDITDLNITADKQRKTSPKSNSGKKPLPSQK